MYNNYVLKSCVWEITRACCFSCKFCGSRAGSVRENELTTAECLDVVRQLADLGCSRVSLIGGEVFLRPDWSYITSELVSNGIKTSIITNGFLVSENVIRTLKGINIESVAISLDGTEAIHDRLRQEGSFHCVDRAVHQLAENGIPVAIITTIQHDNVICLEQIYQILQNWPIYAWQLQACNPMGYAADGKVDIQFSHQAIMDFVYEYAFKAPFAIGIADNIGYYTEAEGYVRGNLSGYAMFSGCRAGIENIGIDSVGNVRGCASMYDDRFIEGNLRETKLRQIWESPLTFRYNRDFKPELLNGVCQSCEFGSSCAGGCRAYNYFTNGDLYSSASCAYACTTQKL